MNIHLITYYWTFPVAEKVIVTCKVIHDSLVHTMTVGPEMAPRWHCTRTPSFVGNEFGIRRDGCSTWPGILSGRRAGSWAVRLRGAGSRMAGAAGHSPRPTYRHPRCSPQADLRRGRLARHIACWL